MSFDHRPGTMVDILNDDFDILGEVEIMCYLEKEEAYRAWWSYPQTGERELIKIPAWRLIKKDKQPIF